MKLTTICYIDNGDSYLMLLRNKKKNDINEGKWLGIGGKFEPGETPEECVCREVFEETGLTLDDYLMRGVITFSSEGYEDEYIYVFTSDTYHGELTDCDEGELRWIRKDELMDINVWEGDKIFLKLLIEGSPFFSVKLSYTKDELTDSSVRLYGENMKK
ncbi:MAG: 8-oxo-dGTP diphosphatase [Lachnospiraceae bacterium]|nr:8-oxo-dGTP diphosphatase [Lachnospiraceae bacterium]